MPRRRQTDGARRGCYPERGQALPPKGFENRAATLKPESAIHESTARSYRVRRPEDRAFGHLAVKARRYAGGIQADRMVE